MPLHSKVCKITKQIIVSIFVYYLPLIGIYSGMTATGLTSFYFASLILISFLIFALGLVFLRDKFSGHKIWVSVFAIVTGLGALALFGSVAFFSSSKFCVICHEMKPNYNTWQRSRHKNVACVGCHLNTTTATGFLVEEPESLVEVYDHLTGNYPKIINRDSRVSQKLMSSGNCTRCHPINQPILTFGSNVKIDHEAHVKQGITCPTCHNRITHRGASGFNYLDGIRMMDGCMRCHRPGKPARIKGKTAPVSCRVCHQDKKILSKTFGSKPVDFNDCDACHQLKDPKIAIKFNKSKMFIEAGMTCQSCHKSHLVKDFVANPDPAVCLDHHKGISGKVVDKKHGGKVKNPFKTTASVRCNFCHKAHTFSNPK